MRLNEKLNLEYVTFLICFSSELAEDSYNLRCILKYFEKYFFTHILIWEIGQTPHYNEAFSENVKYFFIRQKLPVVQKARYLNLMTSEVETPIIAIWEINEIVPPEQLYNSTEAIKTNKADYSFPFSGYSIYNVNRLLLETLIDNGDPLECISENELWKQKVIREFTGQSVVINRRAYINAGRENESIYNWNLNGQERRKRFEILRLNYHETKGILIKIQEDAFTEFKNIPHRYHAQDIKEFLRVCKMQKQELEKDIILKRCMQRMNSF